MAKDIPDNKLQDDKVLAKLYGEGAKETPPAKLNSEILNYAANANKSASENSPVGSHFGGGWKVPLSMAASVVVVFALLVQLDQNPQDLELPPIPEISIPTESTQIDSKDEALNSTIIHKKEQETEEDFADDLSKAPQISEESELNSEVSKSKEVLQNSEARDLILDRESTPIAAPSKPTAANKDVAPQQEQKPQPARERTYQAPLEKVEPVITPRTTNSNEGYAPKLDKAKTIKKQTQEPVGAPTQKSTMTSGSMMEDRAMQPSSSPNREDSLGTSEMAADSDAGVEARTESEFAPLPVEDWLLIIEKLVARKDYAEAARQLQKFKQAHPKVNVMDLESKIP